VHLCREVLINVLVVGLLVAVIALTVEFVAVWATVIVLNGSSTFGSSTLASGGSFIAQETVSRGYAV
jgi:hypothetical protein